MNSAAEVMCFLVTVFSAFELADHLSAGRILPADVISFGLLDVFVFDELIKQTD